MTTLAEVELFREPMDDLTVLAASETATILGELERFDFSVRRDALNEALPGMILPLASAAGDLAREVFRESAPGTVVLRDKNPLPSFESFGGLVYWALEPLFYPDTVPAGTDLDAAVLSRLTGRLQKTIVDAARNQTISDVAVTSAATWVRVHAPDCCAWCTWIASLGNRYAGISQATQVQGRGVDPSVTAGKAGGQGKGVKSRSLRPIDADYHDWCRCSVAPVFRGDTFHHSVKNDALDIVKSITEDRPGNEGDTSTKALLSNMRYDLGLK